jgi:hypothetical protein
VKNGSVCVCVRNVKGSEEEEENRHCEKEQKH